MEWIHAGGLSVACCVHVQRSFSVHLQLQEQNPCFHASSARRGFGVRRKRLEGFI